MTIFKGALAGFSYPDQIEAARTLIAAFCEHFPSVNFAGDTIEELVKLAMGEDTDNASIAEDIAACSGGGEWPGKVEAVCERHFDLSTQVETETEWEVRVTPYCEGRFLRLRRSPFTNGLLVEIDYSARPSESHAASLLAAVEAAAMVYGPWPRQGLPRPEVITV